LTFPTNTSKIRACIILIMYKPYSQEWHRRRYLKEAIDKYLDDGVDPTFIIDDIRNILHARSDTAYAEFQRINQLEHYLSEDINAFNYIPPETRVDL